MRCIWIWGHSWEKPAERLRADIIENLHLFGIYPTEIEVCEKCGNIRLTVTTFIDSKPKRVMMPPYPLPAK